MAAAWAAVTAQGAKGVLLPPLHSGGVGGTGLCLGTQCLGKAVLPARAGLLLLAVKTCHF